MSSDLDRGLDQGADDAHANTPVLRVVDLHTYLFTRWGTTRAVDGVSFDLQRGETLGIVGESGSGKSMLALSLVRLTPEPASKILRGQVLLDGQNLLDMSEKEMREVRGRDISMILQDPHQSLNPVFSVGNQLEETMRIHGGASNRAEARRGAVEALRQVHVPSPEQRMKSYPHEMSGGMKQRIVGAMAIAYRPKVLIADEPTTALDVTIQKQYLKLLKELQAETGVAILLITHDFGVVAESCDRVAVMYAGRLVEQGPVESVFDNPRHPYTRALLSSRPRLDADLRRLPFIDGQPPELTDLPPGCRFAPRCGYALEACLESYPGAVEISRAHLAWCWRSEEEPWANH